MLRKPEEPAESHEKKTQSELHKEQMGLRCPVSLNFYIHVMFPDDTFNLLGSLFSMSYTSPWTPEPKRLLPPDCVNDAHWCGVLLQWKRKLIIGSDRVGAKPVPGNAECCDWV